MRSNSYYIIRGIVRFVVQFIIVLAVFIGIHLLASNIITALIGSAALMGVYILIVKHQNKHQTA